MADTGTWYQRLYGNDPELRQTRDNYAMKENTLPDPARRADLADFFFWTAWVAATERPDYHATYTNNWPPEPLIDNHPTADRKSVVKGKSESVRVDHGGRRILKKKKNL